MAIDFTEKIGPAKSYKTAIKTLPTRGQPAWETQTPAKTNPLDLEAAKKSLKPYENKIKEVKEKLDAFVVDSDEAVILCTEVVSNASDLLKEMEASRKSTIDVPDKYVRSVNKFVKPYRDQIKGIVDSGKGKIGEYGRQKIMAQRKKEIEAKKAADELQAKIDAQAKKNNMQPVQLPRPVIGRSAGPVRSASGTSSTRLEWTYEVEDNAMDVLPRDYLMVDEKAIKAAVKAGIRQIPGVRIFEAPAVSIRT